MNHLLGRLTYLLRTTIFSSAVGGPDPDLFKIVCFCLFSGAKLIDSEFIFLFFKTKGFRIPVSFLSGFADQKATTLRMLGCQKPVIHTVVF